MNPLADSPLPRRRAWPALLLATLAAALGAKVYSDYRNPPAVLLTSAAAAASAASAASGAASGSTNAAAAGAIELGPPVAAAGTPEPQWGQPGEAAARVARAASAALASARAAAGLEPAPPVDQIIELCGVGRLSLPPAAVAAGLTQTKAQATWSRLPPPLAGMAAEPALERVLATLSARDRPERDRAAALVWRALDASEAKAALAVAPGTAASARAAAEANAATAAAAARATATRSLARLARGSRDATVLHWAVAACGREATASAECRRLSLREIVRQQPDDGLFALALALQPGVAPAERDRALQQATQATRFGGHAAQLPLALEGAWPPELPPYLLQDMLLRAHRSAAALSKPGFAAALSLCTAEALAEDGRHGQCQTLARRIQLQGSDLEALDVASVLGARLAWPAAEVEGLRQQHVLLTQAAASLAGAGQPYACSAVDATREWVSSAAADGEIQAARRRLAMNPTTAKPAANRP